MFLAIDQQQQDAAQQLVTSSLASHLGIRSIKHLAGAVGTGKTSVLKLVQREISEAGLTPLFVSAQSEHVDTSATVLSELIDQLHQSGRFNNDSDAFEKLLSPHCPWDQKFEIVKGAIEEDAANVVLICDEPSRWFRSGVDITDVPDQQSRLLSQWLFQEANCRRIVSGFVPEGLPYFEQVTAPTVENAGEILLNTPAWSDAAELAYQVHKTSKRSLYYRSVMEIRLLVARQWYLESVGQSQRIGMNFTAIGLLEHLLNGLEEAAQTSDLHRKFCEGLAKLSISRLEVQESVFDSLMADLPGLAKSVIKGCLCEQWSGRFSLHPLVRYEVLKRSRDHSRRTVNHVWKVPADRQTPVHSQLFDVFSQDGATTNCRRNIEVFHHGSLSGRIDYHTDRNRLHFVQQLHELGRTLSYVYRLHRQSAEVFKLSLEFDGESAYAHHYYAFNLDWLAEDKPEVEHHYQRAIELQPNHPWRWSRWISYLATIGRNQDTQDQWRKACNAMSISEDTTPDWIYRSLHRWVARWLLHWSNLSLARSVLDSIPDKLYDDISFQRLRDLLVALEVAEAGRAVFPLSVPASDWWNATGHTGLKPRVYDRRMLDWFPARVQSVDSNGDLYLTVGRRSESTGNTVDVEDQELQRSMVDKAANGFVWNDLMEGSYIELGYYGNNEPECIGLHLNGPLDDPDLIPLVPPPDRWFNQAVNEAWKERKGGGSELA